MFNACVRWLIRSHTCICWWQRRLFFNGWCDLMWCALIVRQVRPANQPRAQRCDLPISQVRLVWASCNKGSMNWAGARSRAHAKSMKSRTADAYCWQRNGETSRRRFGTWILPGVCGFILYWNYVVFFVSRQGSGANVCMRTPWQHHLIKAHDSPPEICKTSMLWCTPVPFVLFMIIGICSNPAHPGMWQVSPEWPSSSVDSMARFLH